MKKETGSYFSQIIKVKNKESNYTGEIRHIRHKKPSFHDKVLADLK